jgi:hypothetical protein
LLFQENRLPDAVTQSPRRARPRMPLTADHSTMSIYQIVYCSKSRIDGSPEEVEAAIGSILAIARDKNRRAEISGALLFNGAAFAQVLEGPLAAVEEIFEQIQCDPRHSDVVLLRNDEAPARVFPDWKMAYANPAEVEVNPHSTIDLDEAFLHPLASGQRIVRLLEELIHHNYP